MAIYDIDPNYYIEIDIDNLISEITLHLSNIINIQINQKDNIILLDYIDYEYTKIKKIPIFFNPMKNSKLIIQFVNSTILLQIDNIVEYIIENQIIIPDISYINSGNSSLNIYNINQDIYNEIKIEKTEIDDTLLDQMLSELY